ncbi:MAG: glucose-1-phosphate cytidylyltransferase [Clostridiales bacterium]|nr:glucose-1-phosphate cytidylyltransferase [Clostridiales bacterium]
MKVVILAGGYGKRISEESRLRPKPMIEIGEMPILWHIMKYFGHFGAKEFIICCGYKGYTIKEYFADYYLRKSDVTFDFASGGEMTVHNNVSEPWRVTVVDTGADTMTGGRLRRIEKFVGGDRFYLTYGDALSDIHLPSLLQTHIKSGKTATLSAIRPGGRFGALSINERDGSITSFREKAKEDSEWINAGFMIMEHGIFDCLYDDQTVLESQSLPWLSENGKLGVYKHCGFWQCMDTLWDKEQLETLWASGAPWRVWAG